ncbi:hypothetical protein ACHZ97_14770 [Lysobacter soli]|uniref:hypothetical protein n=1 Tax=Lysobacter soli TaxID=453783 RepID=UPI0037C5EE76
MGASVHLMGADLGRVQSSAELDHNGHVRLQMRNNAACESASAVLSLREAQAVIDCLTAAMGTSLAGVAVSQTTGD